MNSHWSSLQSWTILHGSDGEHAPEQVPLVDAPTLCVLTLEGMSHHIQAFVSENHLHLGK